MRQDLCLCTRRRFVGLGAAAALALLVSGCTESLPHDAGADGLAASAASGAGGGSRGLLPAQTPEAATPEAQVQETQTPETRQGEDAVVTDRTHITLSIGDRTFSATFERNDAAAAFAERLPMTLAMSELNGNEKYAYLDEALPVAAERPGTIQAGDIMLFGSDCLVLFYETFSSGYRYTRIGRVDDPAGLAAAVGNGPVRVSWA